MKFNQAQNNLANNLQLSKKERFRLFLYDYYPLIAVLVGYLLVAFSAGPYQNGDTAWEFNAVSNVLKYGLPYDYGIHLMDQPPLGFFIQAALFKTFGSSITNGTTLVTLFGLGSGAIVYFIGRLAYNKNVGFLAALLFAFNPWHILISRSFLIDVPCIFFSLLSTLIALTAVKRNSVKLIVLSGIFFAAAFNTKLYAVFALIPILSLVFFYGKRKITTKLIWLFTFLIPTLISSYIWYELIAKIGLLSIFYHVDLYTINPNLEAPTYFFVANFLVNYGLGWLFIDAIIISLIIGLIYRYWNPQFFMFDNISLAVIISVIGINTILGATLDLKAPFLNAFKYDYQALPFFSFLAASLLSKSVMLLKISKQKSRLKKYSLTLIGIFGLFLIAATIYYSIDHIALFSRWNYFIFRVEPTINAGYSLFNSTPLTQNNPLATTQIIGFIIAFSGIIWIARHKLLIPLNKISRKAKEK